MIKGCDLIILDISDIHLDTFTIFRYEFTIIRSNTNSNYFD